MSGVLWAQAVAFMPTSNKQRSYAMGNYEHRTRQQIKIDDMQFGFMKGKGTTDAIFPSVLFPSVL